MSSKRIVLSSEPHLGLPMLPQAWFVVTREGGKDIFSTSRFVEGSEAEDAFDQLQRNGHIDMLGEAHMLYEHFVYWIGQNPSSTFQMYLEHDGEQDIFVVKGRRVLSDGRVKDYETRSREWFSSNTVNVVGHGTKFTGVLGGIPEFLFREFSVSGLPGRMLKQAGLLDFLLHREVATDTQIRVSQEEQRDLRDIEWMLDLPIGSFLQRSGDSFIESFVVDLLDDSQPWLEKSGVWQENQDSQSFLPEVSPECHCSVQCAVCTCHGLTFGQETPPNGGNPGDNGVQVRKDPTKGD